MVIVINKVLPVLFFPLMSFANTHYSSSHIIKIKNNFFHQTVGYLRGNSKIKIAASIPQLNMVLANLSEKIHNKNAMENFLLKNNYIEYIEPNYPIFLLDKKLNKKYPEGARLWGMQSIKALQAWEIEKGKKNVVIAISDTGAFYNHKDLKKNIWSNPGEVGIDEEGKDKQDNGKDDDGNGYIDDVMGWNFETNNNNPKDDHFHGTHVSGTAGGVGGNGGIAGVSWNSSLQIVKFISGSGSGTTAAAISTIIYAADNGAKVINCSWGGRFFSKAFY